MSRCIVSCIVLCDTTWYMQQNNIEKKIGETLAFFDLFSCPLTAQELYDYAWGGSKEINYLLWCQTLDTFVKKSTHIVCDNGYYMFSDNVCGVVMRQNRVWWVKQKIAIAKKGVKVLRTIPFVRAVFLCNILEKTADKESDIDVCIVAKKNRIWIVRFWAMVLLHICRLRAHGKYTKDRVCLSFYCTEDAFDFSTMRNCAPDIYLAYWVRTLVPLYDPDDCYKKIQDSNTWIAPFIGVGQIKVSNPATVCILGRAGSLFHKFFLCAWAGHYGDIIDGWAKNIQKNRIKKIFSQPEEGACRDVRISDSLLKLHHNDRRALFQRKWAMRCKNLWREAGV